jgi:hypothetical protein
MTEGRETRDQVESLIERWGESVGAHQRGFCSPRDSQHSPAEIETHRELLREGTNDFEHRPRAAA